MPEEIRNGARATLDETMAAVDRRVQENPWTSVGIGFGAGVLFGALITLLARRA